MKTFCLITLMLVFDFFSFNRLCLFSFSKTDLILLCIKKEVLVWKGRIYRRFLYFLCLSFFKHLYKDSSPTTDEERQKLKGCIEFELKLGYMI